MVERVCYLTHSELAVSPCSLQASAVIGMEEGESPSPDVFRNQDELDLYRHQRMINTWFISDTHFGHCNILEYEKEARPFASVDEMNEKIIDNWNKTVNQKDVVYHLGDFAFGKRNLAIAERLNGRKKLVLGNHDVYDFRLYLHYFERLYGVFQWNRCVLTHVPIHPQHLGQRFWMNIHGHLHSKTVQKPVEGWHELTNHLGLPVIVRKPFDNEFEDDLNYFNVSCERHNLTPLHADVIMDRLKEIDSD